MDLKTKNDIIFQDDGINICKNTISDTDTHTDTNNNQDNITYKISYPDYYFNYYEDLFNIYKINYALEDINENIDENINQNNIRKYKEKVIIINKDKYNNNYDILSLEEFIKYNQYNIFDIDENVILKVLYDIGFIIKLLERENKSIFSISIKDIIVVNNDTFLFVNMNKIMNINKKYIYYQKPLLGNELLKLPFSISNNKPIDELPIKVYYNNVYYSFGILLLDLLCYNKKKDFVNNMNCLKILKTFKKYKFSGLYYFIERCLQENSEDRVLLFL